MKFIINNAHLQKVIFADGEDYNRDVIIPDGVKVIEKMAFSQTHICSVVMPDTVEHISESAFHVCDKLEKIVFSANLESIGEYAFADCHELKEVKLPASLRYIDNYAFSVCTMLKKVEIPSVCSIGVGAFSCCAIEELTLPENLISLEKYCFYSNPALEGVNFRSSISDIPLGAFMECTKLQKITFPKQLKKISTQAFAKCKALGRIEIPSGVTCIEKYAFQGCEKLCDIVLNEGLEVIEEGAFCACESLEDIFIPRSVQTIGGAVFKDCSKLRCISLLHNEQEAYPSFCVRENNDLIFYTPNLPVTAHIDEMIYYAARGFVYMYNDGKYIDERIAQSYISFIGNELDSVLRKFDNDAVLFDFVLRVIKPSKEIVDRALEKCAGNIGIVAMLLKYKKDQGMTIDDYEV